MQQQYVRLGQWRAHELRARQTGIGGRLRQRIAERLRQQAARTIDRVGGIVLRHGIAAIVEPCGPGFACTVRIGPGDGSACAAGEPGAFQ
jgi:hypothetical protein